MVPPKDNGFITSNDLEQIERALDITSQYLMTIDIFHTTSGIICLNLVQTCLNPSL